MRFAALLLSCALAAVLLAAQAAANPIVPFVETFEDDAGWTDVNENPLVHVPTGGADGGGFVTNTITPVLGGTIFAQGRPDEMASGGAFTGDWITGGVTELRAFVRHDAPVPVSVFFRITCCGANFPAQIGVVPIPLPPSTDFQEITLDLDLSNPLLIPEAGTVAQNLSSVTNLQVGAEATTGFSGPITFDLDLVRIVPEPGTALLTGLGLASLSLVSRRRRVARA